MTLPRNAQLWLSGYISSRLADWNRAGKIRRVWVSLCDHYEPLWLQPDMDTARRRVATWTRLWPEIASRHADSAGRRPKHTFFFPQEEYRPEFLDPLARMTSDGIGDVDIHIHHDCEGERNFMDRMRGFIEALTRNHGLLRQHEGRTVFGFIHGNWALDNSRPDGRWCGLNNEITLLRELGCYADFTMPSGASPTQSRILNSIYWVKDDPERPRSFDTGTPVTPGHPGSGDLLMVNGPMGLRWRERLQPRVETGEMAHQDLATKYRVERWLDLAPRIGEDVFVKLYTHGAQERNSAALLEKGGLDGLFRLLGEVCGERNLSWYSVSAWEMRQAIDAASRNQNPVETVAAGPSVSAAKP